MSESSESRESMERGGGGGLPPDNRKCYKCGESGHFIRDCAEFWQAKAQGLMFIPSSQVNTQACTGRPAVVGTNTMARRSRSAESGNEKSATGEDMNALMREYFVQMAEERRLRVEREAEEVRLRQEAEERRIKENRRLQRQEERLRLEEERDTRLLRIVWSEMRKDREEERARYKRKGKGAARMSVRNEAMEAEKEKLRRLIAPKILEPAEEAEDEELLSLRRMAARLNLVEKRKRGPDIPIGNSPPMVTPEKKLNTKLTEETKARIEPLKSEQGADYGSASTPSKIDLSLKHISASCGVGGKERFEQECQNFYDSLSIEELKEACRREKVTYGKKELAIRRLVIRRAAIAYDPVVIPLPSTPCTGTRSTKGVVIKEVKDVEADEFSDSDESYFEEGSE
ncbi:hypothetical protein CBR_g20348 [Chara braunii]|uniref:CCHC-type domain-containing protein n=1 Tax=Chara braunii TaxID=69332 RepID=A0A388JU77_CHABU|nr:hypothetical protein CBR_g20348 [Chara braunii]|eukprot:GBG61313.1 hypothetical protein CBR_g20348 [Chara braunii]